MVCPAVVLAAVVAAGPALPEPVVRPDPPAARVAWPDPLPAAFAVPSDGSPEVLPADHAAPFAALVTRPAPASYAVLDLTTGRRIGGWTAARPPVGPRALSPDGRWFVAATRFAASGAGPEELVGYDVAAGREAWAVRLPAGASRVRFAGPDRVVVYPGRRSAEPPPAEVRRASSGELVRALTVPPGQDWGAPVVAGSPGGRYAAFASGRSAHVVDLDSGRTVHTFDPPADADEYYADLAFSPAGDRLAAALMPSAATVPWYRLVSWDLASGRRDGGTFVFAHPGPTGSNHDVRMVRWTPDGAAWLVPRGAVVDPGTGATLYAIGQTADDALRETLIPAAAHRLLRFGTAPDTGRYRVEAVGTSRDGFASAVKAVRYGGVAADGWLPGPAAFAPARPAPFPGAADDWTVTPDPAAGPVHAVGKPVALPFAFPDVESARMTAGPAAVFAISGRRDVAAGPRTGRKVVRVDPAAGTRTGEVRVPAGVRLAAAGPGGDVVLTVDAAQGRRVDAWSLASGRPVAGWLAAEEGTIVLDSWLPAADKALTLTSGGRLTLWDVPQKAAVYAVDLPGLSAAVLSPGGRFLFGRQGGRVRAVEAATGRPAGDLDLPFDPAPGPDHAPGRGPVVSLLVLAGGRELAAVALEPPGNGRAGGHAARWDLATGKLLGSGPLRGVQATGFEAPAGEPAAVPFGAHHAVTSGRRVFDLRTCHQVARLDGVGVGDPGAVRVLPGSPDGRLWYAAQPPGGGRDPVLVAADPPAELTGTPTPVTGGDRPLWRPGTRVAVRAKFDGPLAGEGARRAERMVEAHLVARGLRAVAADPEVTFELTAGAERVGPAARVPAGRDPAYRLRYALQVVGGGKTLWEAATNADGWFETAFGFDPEAGALPPDAAARVWGHPTAGLLRLAVPAEVLPARSGYLPLPVPAGLTPAGVALRPGLIPW